MDSINLNISPFSVDNIFGLIAFIGGLIISVMSFIIKNKFALKTAQKDDKEAVKTTPKSKTLEDEAVESYKTMFKGLMDRQAMLEAKVEHNEKQIATWEQKYIILQSKAEHDRFKMTRIINTQANKILEQTNQINNLQAEVKSLKQKLVMFTSNNQVRL